MRPSYPVGGMQMSKSTLARLDHGPEVPGDESAAKAIALGTATAISLSYVAASIA